MTEDRNLNHEKRIKAYLFNGGFDRFFDICKNIGVTANINAIKSQLEEEKDNITKCNNCDKPISILRNSGLCPKCLEERKNN